MKLNGRNNFTNKVKSNAITLYAINVALRRSTVAPVAP